MCTPDGFSDNPLCAEMERRCADMLLVSQAVVTCADVFEQACEPRAPKPEWFGTGPGQWDSWWVEDNTCANGVCRNIVELTDMIHDDNMTACLPVARTGYPAPVGWKVVGE